MQMALAAAALSNGGTEPAPRIATAVNTPTQGWVILPARGDPRDAFTPQGALDATSTMLMSGYPFWQWNAVTSIENLDYTWSLAGTIPNAQGSPFAMVVLLEENNPELAASISESLLDAALYR
jgi:hypothetical protein